MHVTVLALHFKTMKTTKAIPQRGEVWASKATGNRVTIMKANDDVVWYESGEWAFPSHTQTAIFMKVSKRVNPKDLIAQ